MIYVSLLITIAIGISIGLWAGIEIGTKKPKRKYEPLDLDNTGEQMVMEELIKYFPKENNYLINNVTLKIKNGGSTQIDHILINEYGIFVIETKHYSGWIFGREADYQWTQTFGKGKKYKFYNPIKQNQKHMEEIKKRMPFINASHFKSVIIFSGEAEIKTDTGKETIYIQELKDHLKSYSSKVLKKYEICQIIGVIEFERKEVSEQTDKEHIKYVNSRKTWTRTQGV